jgi:hypothetical protein
VKFSKGYYEHIPKMIASEKEIEKNPKERKAGSIIAELKKIR